MASLNTFIYTNRSKTALRMIVEPWADQYTIQPGQRVDIVVRGDPALGSLELEQFPEGITIYGYTGCVVSLSSDGEELAPDPQ